MSQSKNTGEVGWIATLLPERAVMHFGMCYYFLIIFYVRPYGVIFMALRLGVGHF